MAEDGERSSWRVILVFLWSDIAGYSRIIWKGGKRERPNLGLAKQKYETLLSRGGPVSNRFRILAEQREQKIVDRGMVVEEGTRVWEALFFCLD